MRSTTNLYGQVILPVKPRIWRFFFSDLKESAIELTVNAQQRQYSTVQPSQLDRSEVGRGVTGACGLLGHWPWRLRVGLPI